MIPPTEIRHSFMVSFYSSQLQGFDSLFFDYRLIMIFLICYLLQINNLTNSYLERKGFILSYIL